LNIHDMAREGLKLELPLAIRQVNSQNSAVTYSGVQVRCNGETQSLNLTVKPLKTSETASGLMLVAFEEISPPEPKTPAKKKRTPAGENGPKNRST
jgi:two-component system CheB/CheR fusion protein